MTGEPAGAAPLDGRSESGQQLVRRPARVGLFPRGRPAGRPGRRRAGLRPPPGRDPPRHQALQPPARRPGERLGDRLRPGQVRRGGRPVAVARPGRDAAVHGSRAVPGRHRPAGRHLLAGRDALRAADAASRRSPSGTRSGSSTRSRTSRRRRCGSTTAGSLATWRRWCSRRWPRTPRTGSPRPASWATSCGGSWRAGRSARGRSRPPSGSGGGASATPAWPP